MSGSRSGWAVESVPEFLAWWTGLDRPAQRALGPSIELVERLGPALEFPHSSQIRGSAVGGMRELRVQHRGRPFRLLYAFDHRRVAVFLVGGDKGVDARWYPRMIRRADLLFARHLEETGGS